VAGGNEKASAATLVAIFTSFEQAEARMKSKPKTRMKRKIKKAARARPEQAVIKADGAADGDGEDAFARADGARFARLPKSFLMKV